MLVKRVLTVDTITNQNHSYTLGALGNPMPQHPKSPRLLITNLRIVRVQPSVKSFHDLLSRYRQNPQNQYIACRSRVIVLNKKMAFCGFAPKKT